MRILTIISLVFFGCGMVVVAQAQQEDRPPWERTSDRQQRDRTSNRSDDRSSRSSDRSPWGGGPPPTMPRGGFPQGGFPQGGFQRGGIPQRQTPERGNSSDRTSRMMDMFRSMDANRNGVLEPSEISETRRGFVSAIATRMGADPSRPINLADLERRAAASNSARPNDSNRNNMSESNRSRSATAATSEPLVPAFGEQQPAETPTLAFGQREPIVPIPVNPTAQAAATNPTAPATPQAARSSTSYDNIAADVRENTSLDWFFAYDRDADGQLTMQEYVGGYGGTWTPAIASEFRFLDRNGDGFSTLDEVLLTLKEVDEQRAAEAAKETEQNRPVPGQPGSSPPQPVPPGIQPPSAANGAPSPNVVPVSANGAATNSAGYSSNRRGDDSRRNRRSYSRTDQ